MDCAIRQLEHDSDAEGWALLRKEALECHPLAFGATVPDDPRQLVDLIKERIGSSKESVVFGAFRAASMIGIVGLRRHAGKKERHKASIWGMYVTAGSRRGGVGDMLLCKAIDQARSWPGVEQIHLTVSDLATEARRLYEKHGFREWGREPRALCWEGRCVDEAHMVLDLRESQRTV